MNKYKKNREFFEEKLKKLSECKRVVDVGGGAPFQKDMAKYENWFDGVNYQTLDYSSEFQPDIVGDIHKLPFNENELDGILCKAVLEHVNNPILAVSEMHRSLRPGGRILLWVPFLYPYHSHSSEYGDYWRFTEDALKLLFRDFSSLEYVASKGYFHTLLTLGPLPKPLENMLTPVAHFFDLLLPVSHQYSGYTIYAEK